jgi:glutamine amidotransferase
MCRILSYLGLPILVEELLYKPNNSFIQQSYNPKYMSHLMNLAGFGMAAWDPRSPHSALPYLYRTTQLPFYDENLRNLAAKITPSCLLAHIRGVSYDEKQVVSAQNVHPFVFANTNIALAHNGILTDFEKMKYELLNHIQPHYQVQIKGTTDSEWIYAIFLSQLPNTPNQYTPKEIATAIIDTLAILQKVRAKYQIHTTSPVNLFITNGDFIAATRFVFDYGWQPLGEKATTHSTYHSLWYTYGESYGLYDNDYRMRGNHKKTSLIVASEPLTEDATTWIEVPEYTLLIAHVENANINIISEDICI